MTEDYKKELLNYVTGNLEETSPTTDEIIKEEINVNRNNWLNYMPSSWQNMRIEGFIKPNENTSDIGIMYGGYKDSNNNSHGFIILVDTNMNPVKYITKFESGTELRYIQCMIQGDDNLFYAIDDAELSYKNINIYNTQKRFLMLNNFSVSIDGDYKVNLRKSYILSGSNYQNFYCKDIFKQSGTSHFVFCGWYAISSAAGADGTRAIELTINVGSANEWNHYEAGSRINYLTGFVTFNNNNQSKIQTLNIPTTTKNIYLYTKDYTSSSLSQSTIQTLDYTVFTNFDIEQQALFMNENDVYFIVDNQDLYSRDIKTHQPIVYPRHLALYHYNISTTLFETIYDNYMGDSSSTLNVERMQIDKNEGKLYIALYNNFNNNNTIADYYIQRYENTWNPIKVGNQQNISRTQRAMYVANKYNLLQIVLYPVNFRFPTWYFYIAKEVYNPTQYNGKPYTGVNSFCPLYSNLYSNGSLIFSRNLYNVSKQNNMTMSSVEIPSNYLNDTTITQNDLISETNLQLVNNQNAWTKNIYEIVDLNFLNTISVIDEDTNTPYLESAIKVNNATTDGGDTNYQNTSCNKYRINYLDGTTSIGALVWNSINNYNKKTQITFYVDKEINSIDLISNDETTVYLNIPVEVEIGKTYTIKQKVRTGDKLTPVQLQYNNENVNYNNEPVMVYIEEVNNGS